MSRSQTGEMIYDGHLGGFIRGGDPWTWCPELWIWAVAQFDAKSVLDVGCGEGHAVDFFLKLGCDAYGIEGSLRAINHSPVKSSIICHDYCDGPYVPRESFDLVWCCEFVEHVAEKFVPNFMATLTCARKAILLTHAIPGQDGYHHVNCKPMEYWRERFSEYSFELDESLTNVSRQIGYFRTHYVTKGLVFIPRFSE